LARPSLIVIPAMVAVTPPLISKTRLALLPLMVRRLAPGPSMVRSSVMLSSPLVRAMVPVVAKLIASAPGLALAAATAPRSESGPPSRRLSTVKVLGRQRSSRTSTRGRLVGRREGRQTPATDGRDFRDF